MDTKTNPIYKMIIFALLAAGAIFLLSRLIVGHDLVLFHPQGLIALKEHRLMVVSVLLMLIIVVPVFITTIWIAFKYREGNHATYAPNSSHTRLTELLWWTVPGIIVVILALITWPSAHNLHPLKPIESANKPITIQVVALQWKWLFIYPEQNIATVNFIQFPKDTPVTFELTADAPMNSFWIPSLGGQIYAMAGMRTKINLIANNNGDFQGSGAEMSGAGFADMKFTARASSQEDFNAWVASVKQSPETIFLAKYNKLMLPSENNPPTLFSSVESGLYDKIVMKYMSPDGVMGMPH